MIPDKKTILILEDDKQIQVLYEFMLASDYELLVTDSIEQAKRLLDEYKVDCIILDLFLGVDKSGLEFSRLVKEDPTHAHIPVLVVTAHMFSEDSLEIQAAGCDDYILKPIDRAVLIEKLKTHTLR